MEPPGQKPTFIATEPRIGYRFVLPVGNLAWIYRGAAGSSGASAACKLEFRAVAQPG